MVTDSKTQGSTTSWSVMAKTRMGSELAVSTRK